MNGYKPLTGFERIYEVFASAAGTVRRTFDFIGRSRRAEFLCYWLASMVVLALLDWLASSTLELAAQQGVDVALGALVTLPFFGLIARRFHDMGLSGWLVLPAVPTVILGVYREYWYRFTAPDVMIQGLPYEGTIALLALPGILIAFWALIQEGQKGTNRYGPDPRLPADRQSEGEAAVG